MSHYDIICHRGGLMRKVELRMNEKEKYNVIKELVDHNGNKNRAAKKLGISKRHVNRLILKYKEKNSHIQRIIDFLYESGQTYWQVLPLNDVDVFGSPFCSTCVNSGNPLFIDISEFISKREYLQLEENKDVEFDDYKQTKMKLLSKIYKKVGLNEESNCFISNNEWVIKYGEFMAIKEEYNDQRQ